MKINLWQKRLLLVLVSLLILLLGFWIGQKYSMPKQSIRPARIIKNKSESPPHRARSSLREASRSPSTLPSTTSPQPQVKSQGPAGVNEICQNDWQRVAQADVSQLENTMRDRQGLLTQPCVLAMMNEIKNPIVQRFLETCHQPLLTLAVEEFEQRCLGLIFPFRAFVSRRLGPGTQNLQALDSSVLINQLVGGQMALRESSVQELNHNIRIADALIAKDPDQYLAYKAKLISLLVKELRFGETVDPTVYEDLYSEMLTFTGVNPEDDVLATANALQRGEDPAFIPTEELAGIDRDLVHIPFLRLSALGDVATLQAIAEEYMVDYPNSHIGYLYSAEALWRQGREAEALNRLREGIRSEGRDQLILRMFSQLQTNPVDRLYRLSMD